MVSICPSKNNVSIQEHTAFHFFIINQHPFCILFSLLLIFHINSAGTLSIFDQFYLWKTLYILLKL